MRIKRPMTPDELVALRMLDQVVFPPETFDKRFANHLKKLRDEGHPAIEESFVPPFWSLLIRYQRQIRHPQRLKYLRMAGRLITPLVRRAKLRQRSQEWRDARNRNQEAKGIHQAGMERVRTQPVPTGQKYAPGTRVRIDDHLDSTMAHFPSGKNATVRYTYDHAFGGGDIDSYCLDIDGHGEVAWYYEGQLTPISP